MEGRRGSERKARGVCIASTSARVGWFRIRRGRPRTMSRHSSQVWNTIHRKAKSGSRAGTDGRLPQLPLDCLGDADDSSLASLEADKQISCFGVLLCRLLTRQVDDAQLRLGYLVDELLRLARGQFREIVLQ